MTLLFQIITNYQLLECEFVGIDLSYTALFPLIHSG